MKRVLIATLAVALLALALPVTAAPVGKVKVCHVTGNGKVLLLSIGSPALYAHLGHGDYEPYTYYQDNDGDGLGNPHVAIEACEQPDGFVENPDDPNDEVPEKPGQSEEGGEFQYQAPGK